MTRADVPVGNPPTIVTIQVERPVIAAVVEVAAGKNARTRVRNPMKK